MSPVKREMFFLSILISGYEFPKMKYILDKRIVCAMRILYS